MKTTTTDYSISFFTRYFIVTVACLLFIPALYGQHTITVEWGDTVYLDTDNCRGTLQWQVSFDEQTWNDLPERTSDTLKYVPFESPTYLRLQIVEGDCDPHYAEIVTVNITPSLPVVETLSPLNIGPMSAYAGGKVVYSGGSAIVAQGIVYSTQPGPTVLTASQTSENTDSRDFMSVLSGLAPNTTYYIRAYAVNDLGPAYGEEFEFTTLQNITYAIGDEGPAGGIIFYDKGSYSQGWRYLEAAPAGWAGTNDPWFDIFWGCESVMVGETSTDVGAGFENTKRILSAGCAGDGSVLHIVANATVGGYTDWFLPSRDELYHLYNNLFNLGPNFHSVYGFQTKTYTSSSEYNATSAWGYDFAAGGNIQHAKSKIASIAVRAVRRF